MAKKKKHKKAPIWKPTKEDRAKRDQVLKLLKKSFDKARFWTSEISTPPVQMPGYSALGARIFVQSDTLHVSVTFRGLKPLG